MTVGVLKGKLAPVAKPSELHTYLMAAARIVETVSFEMAQDHSAEKVAQMLRIALDIERRAQDVLQRSARPAFN